MRHERHVLGYIDGTTCFDRVRMAPYIADPPGCITFMHEQDEVLREEL